MAVSLHDLLQPGPDPPAGLHHVALGDVLQHLRDAVLYNLLGVVRSLVYIPFSNATHKIVEGIAIR